MKYKYKLAMIMGIIAMISALAILIMYDYYNHSTREKEIYHEINYNIKVVAQQIEEDIENLIILTKSIASTPIIKDSLIQSNSEFGTLNEKDRETRIEDLNDIWMNTKDISDVFIQDRIKNKVGQYLSEQQNQEPDLFGEMFVTNKYGVMTATTKKLTTLAHCHKYWWIGSFSDGKGNIYLDDRGFDKSVGEYVLGIVVPVYGDDGRVIGIIKSNYKIASLLTEELEFISQVQDEGEYAIVRPSGLIVSKKNTEPLSESINDFIKPFLNTEKTVVRSNEDLLYGVTSITMSNSNYEVLFGGNSVSKGNTGGSSEGGWNVVYTIPIGIAHKAESDILKSLIVTSSILILAIVIVSLRLGRYVAKPIEDLREYVKSVGSGDFSLRINRLSSDEIGDLSEALNDMVVNLEKITTTKDKLEKEIVDRKELEKRLVEISQEDALTKIYNRRAFDIFYHKYVERAKRSSTNLAVILFDIDDFKKVNDVYGHPVGDEVLIIIAEKISKLMREADIFARWGGEEFILLLPDTNVESALEVAERVRKTIEQTEFPTKERITISLGVSIHKEDNRADAAILRADDALYKAKRTGKNRTEVNVYK